MGSNSFHLLIAHWREGKLQVMHRRVERVQTALLMQGTRLTRAAEKRVLDCLAHFRQVADQFGCERIVAVGTAALRRASNADALLSDAQAVLGWPIAVLSGEEEARFIYLAVAAYQHSNARRLVLDIGGGSTEMIIGQGESIEDLESAALGCVSSLRHHFVDGALDRQRFDACVEQAAATLAPLAGRYRVLPGMRVIGCSGTAGAIAAVLGERQVRLADLIALRDRILAQFTNTAQVSFSCLDQNRSLLLVPGLALLVALFDTLGIHEMESVDIALREGVAIAWFQGDLKIGVEPRRGIAI
jgi:exopolyphosphatase/guanosine-5'-triphosphate,3'-diphosphate pyrophosphatase